MNILDIANKNSFGGPRLRLFNSIFYLRKINAKLMLNSQKTIFSHFYISLNMFMFISSAFIMLKCVENCGPRHPPKRVPWARCRKIFKITLIHINFFKKPNEKIYSKTKNLYCDAIMFVF